MKNWLDYVTEAKDAQKDTENKELQKNDASHGEKGDVLEESVKFNLEQNIGKVWGDDLEGVDGIALKAVSKNSFVVAVKEKNVITLINEKGVEIRLDGSMIDQIVKLQRRR